MVEGLLSTGPTPSSFSMFIRTGKMKQVKPDLIDVTFAINKDEEEVAYGSVFAPCEISFKMWILLRGQFLG